MRALTFGLFIALVIPGCSRSPDAPDGATSQTGVASRLPADRFTGQWHFALEPNDLSKGYVIRWIDPTTTPKTMFGQSPSGHLEEMVWEVESQNPIQRELVIRFWDKVDDALVRTGGRKFTRATLVFAPDWKTIQYTSTVDLFGVLKTYKDEWVRLGDATRP